MRAMNFMKFTSGRHWRLLILAVVLVAIQAACSRPAKLSEYPPFIDLPTNVGTGELAKISTIVVGRILRVAEVGSPQPSRWGSLTPVQLFEVDIEAENIISGRLNGRTQPVFFFRNAGAWSGPARMGLKSQGGVWSVGDREIFFLQQDGAALRTICDDYAHCAFPVLTGSHSTFVRHQARWIGDDLVDILLTRGDGCSESQMATAISKSASEARSLSGDYAVTILRSFSTGPSMSLRLAACNALEAAGEAKCVGDGR
jgi:hypothetical protein